MQIVTRGDDVQIGDLVSDNFSNCKTLAAYGRYICRSAKSFYADDDGEAACLRLSSIAMGQRVNHSKSTDFGKAYRFGATKNFQHDLPEIGDRRNPASRIL